ncbi:MAG: YcgL domain-containing protein [Paraglaciecola sp.]|uniref:YcgL domain-containing protein n=1 Tax=Paraglaciecola sp. TaxID=1920173 RepID=UPI00273E5F03|nr:YcgL domain-containing protein [Paraglaciecola sp.]MDP5028914.1 YcgL domain-containing protein [Paraglaciecola sp.]MDP5041160.1 YcgL domain-containing protein [Paraglaciecola sp.]MDP5132582.1 YcgL domain-containing protein [Paraglaciecola sp.]
MLCAVYKSSKKAETYLYVPGRDDFSQVPPALMNTFGSPIFLMIMPLKNDRKLASMDIEKLRSELTTKGFYLQLPPPVENMLKSHLAAQRIE